MRTSILSGMIATALLLTSSTVTHGETSYEELFNKVVIPADSHFQFPDIGTHWARSSLTDLAAAGILSGSDGKMEPDRLITRAEFITLLDRATEVPIPRTLSQRPFRDVPTDAWYAPYIAGAYASGITKGMGDGTFQPDRPITRAEIAAFMNNAIPFQGSNGTSFWDVSDGAWYAQAVKRLAYASIIGGYTDGGFHPSANATRGELASMLDHFLQSKDTGWGVGDVSETVLTSLVEQYVRQGVNMYSHEAFPLTDLAPYTAGLEYEELLRTKQLFDDSRQEGIRVNPSLDHLSTQLLYNGGSVAAVQASLTATTIVTFPDGSSKSMRQQKSAIFFLMKSGLRNKDVPMNVVIYASTPWTDQQ